MVLVIALVCTVAAAQDRALVVGPMEPELVSRIEGQTADLAWQIAVEDAAVPPDLAAVRAYETRARVVAWFVRTARGYDVSIADLRDRRILTQAVDAPEGEALAESALYETVAYLFRTTLEALALGGSFGVEMEEPARPVEVRPPNVEVRPTIARPRGTARLDGAIGYATAIDGRFAHAPLASLGLWLGSVRLGLGGEVGVPVSDEGATVSIELARHRVHASIGFDLVSAESFSLVAEAQAGAVLYRRATIAARAPLVAAEPETSASPLVSLELRAILWIAGAFGVFLEAGADAILLPPVFEVSWGGNALEVGSAWPVAPRLAAGVVLRSGFF
jgi:hypothetical protein